mmetsp:Transcript_57460/g.136625  ORF Transcript_57460/g.136625 Transcript_57460/m.136625 type:complete len:336 (-) Transcript_57460:94-1101(-)
MERSTLLMSSALGLYAVSMVEVPASFLAPGASVGGLRGAASPAALGSNSAGRTPLAGAAAGGLRYVAAGLAASAACMSLQAGKSSRRRVQRQAQQYTPGLLASALITAANEGGESLEVAQEMFALKKKFDEDDGETMRTLLGKEKPMTKEQITKSRQAAADLASLAITADGESWDDLVDKVYKPAKKGPKKTYDAVSAVKTLVPDMATKTLPKFVSFVDKKNMIASLPEVCTAYSTLLYKSQSVSPVIVRSAQTLSDAQKSAIEKKMKAKIGVEEVKLINVVEASLIAGFRIEWNFRDPVTMTGPKEKEDISFSRALERALLAKTGREDVEKSIV